ncbi:MAG: TOBE domain-containing protein, partial [Tabrizicola sp.]
VMSQGRIQQIADPKEIYNNPVNGFVASFVGENNIFTGTVGTVADGMAAFETPEGTFRARIAPEAQGKALKLYVRPEHTLLTETPGENAIPVTVAEVAFEGAFISVHARTEKGMTITAEIRNDGSATVPDLGAKLHARFDPARAALLPDANVRS